VPNKHARKALHAYVSDNAHDQWHEFAAHQGVSVSAILEALGPALTGTTSPEAVASIDLSNVVSQARHIDARRRRRRQ
jgi:hypothetical protein